MTNKEKKHKTFMGLKRGDRMWRISLKTYPYEIESCVIRKVECYSDHSFRFHYCGKCSLKYIGPCFWFDHGCSELYSVNARDADSCFLKTLNYFFTTVEDIAKTEQQLMMAEYQSQVSSQGGGGENSVKTYLEEANKRMLKITQPSKQITNG